MFITKRKNFFFLSQCKVTFFFYICEKLNRNNYFCQKLVNCYDKLKNRLGTDNCTALWHCCVMKVLLTSLG